MESIVISDQWDRQCQLQKIDLLVIEEQLNLVATMMIQVMTLLHFTLVL